MSTPSFSHEGQVRADVLVGVIASDRLGSVAIQFFVESYGLLRRLRLLAVTKNAGLLRC